MSNDKYELSDGDKIYIRAVTYHYTGKVVHVTKNEIFLESAAWVVNSGNFTQAMVSGKIEDVEPYPDNMVLAVNRRAIVDYVNWPHDLPRPSNK